MKRLWGSLQSFLNKGRVEKYISSARLRGKVTLSLWEFAKSVSEKFKLACGSDSEFF